MDNECWICHKRKDGEVLREVWWNVADGMKRIVNVHEKCYDEFIINTKASEVSNVNER
jgi:hypothetical protein